MSRQICHTIDDAHQEKDSVAAANQPYQPYEQSNPFKVKDIKQ